MFLNYDNLLVVKAKCFAVGAHEAIGQKRKYNGEPYWKHPERVAQLVFDVGGTPEQVAAAWLHDVVEDTQVELRTICDMFGDSVYDLVSDMTDVSKPEDGNRATRKALDRMHTASASPEAKTIKLADLLDNSRSIIEVNNDFTKIYMAEKKLLLDVLKEGNQELYDMATQVVEEYYKEK